MEVSPTPATTAGSRAETQNFSRRSLANAGHDRKAEKPRTAKHGRVRPRLPAQARTTTRN
eukprot:12721407-Alexandrium_andersonii.AAC.1